MAAGDTLIIFDIHSAELPSSNLALWDKRNGRLTLKFANNADLECYFPFILPRKYGGNGITVNAKIVSDATSGNHMIGTSFEAEGTDIDSDSFAAESTGTGAVSGTSGIDSTIQTAHTHGAQIDSISVGQRGRLKFRRLGANGSDTAENTMYLLGLELRETP